MAIHEAKMAATIASQMGYEMKPIKLTKSQRLVSLKPELRSRIDKQTGKRFVYLCQDRFSGSVVLTPKLTTLADYLSSQAGPLKQDQVTVSSLYHILSVKDGEGRTGSWSKGRWRVRAVPLDSAVDAFEELRANPAYEQAVVLGH